MGGARGFHGATMTRCGGNRPVLPSPWLPASLLPGKDSGVWQSCVTIGCRTAFSHPTTLSSITAAMRGTSWPTSPGASCQSDGEAGREVLPSESWHKPPLASLRFAIWLSNADDGDQGAAGQERRGDRQRPLDSGHTSPCHHRSEQRDADAARGLPHGVQHAGCDS
jgi:hypothetical protein